MTKLMRGIHAGAVFFHLWSLKCRKCGKEANKCECEHGDMYFFVDPHFHVIGYGYIMNVKEFNIAHENWRYANFGRWNEIGSIWLGLPSWAWYFVLLSTAQTVLMYFWFESDRLSDTASFLFLTIPRFLIPPIGLISFAIGIIVLMGKNSPFEAYRSSALFLLDLTAIFYFFIY